MASTRLLTAEDIYDVYGIEWALSKAVLDKADQFVLEDRLRDIKNIYVAACKSRIRAEAKFLGVDLDGDNFQFSRVLTKIGDLIGKAFEQNAEQMMRGGSFNLMGTILQAHQAGGADLKGIDLSRFGLNNGQNTKTQPKDVDPDWFMSTKNNGGRVWNDPRWAEIAKAYVAVEEAATSHQIIQSIDRLNQLQHNSFHVLIDLQTGRMLTDHTNSVDDRQARQRLQEVLDIKLKSVNVLDFKDKMSGDVRRTLTKYRGVL